ncbi:hypothetical protein [Arachidicoccus sp.]|uniref:hypothetical protein n=1 Tax=Arachidicoccus sp. TaxID=1872624 RepID=UPI003D20A45D
MFTEKEKNFMSYWETNRLREKSWKRQIRAGLPIGTTVAVAILITFFSGWYKLAMMEASTELSPWVLILAIMLIAITFGAFYKKQKWEQHEQLYKELIARQEKETHKLESNSEDV